MQIELGKMQELTVVKRWISVFTWLRRDNRGGQGSASRETGAGGLRVGDRITVFVYRDSRDRLISTTTKPGLCLGEVAVLTVAQTGKLGAFLDWGPGKGSFSAV